MRAAFAFVLGVAVLAACSAEPRQTNANAMHAPLNAGQVAEEIEASKAVTPLPPGASWRSIDLDPSATYGELSGLSFVEFQAACRWFEAAIAAHAAGDAEALGDARAVIGTIPRWRSFSDPTATVPDFRAHIAHLSAAALSDDLRDVVAFRAANCLE